MHIRDTLHSHTVSQYSYTVAHYLHADVFFSLQKRERINVRHRQEHLSGENTAEVQERESGVQRNTREALAGGDGAHHVNLNSDLPTHINKTKTLKIKSVSISSEAPLVFS